MRLVAMAIVVALAGCALITREHYAVFFQPQSAELDAGSRQMVATLAHKAVQRPGALVTVSGYADPDGSAPDNLKLSARRARAVATALTQAGVDPARIRRHAEGGVDYASDSVESRRVEIVLGAP